jgi:hypothetical protein
MKLSSDRLRDDLSKGGTFLNHLQRVSEFVLDLSQGMLGPRFQEVQVFKIVTELVH